MKTKFSLHALFILFVLIMLIPGILFSQTTISIRLGPSTGQDCEVVTYSPNTPMPYSTELVAAFWTYESNINIWRPLLKFNFQEVPQGSQIISGKLSLYGNPYPSSVPHSGKNESYLRKVTADWNQNTATWNNQPGFSIEDQVLLPQSLYSFQDYLDIDVTELVRDMINNPSSNFGFVIMNRIEDVFRCLNFASSKCILADKRPKIDLIINTIGIEPISTNIPADYKLYQNFPNPFNPVTNIKFDLPRSSFIRLEIFDEVGRVISTLVNEKLNGGTYLVKWDGSNFGSGAYFVKLESGNKMITKKIILIK